MVEKYVPGIKIIDFIYNNFYTYFSTIYFNFILSSFSKKILNLKKNNFKICDCDQAYNALL